MHGMPNYYPQILIIIKPTEIYKNQGDVDLSLLYRYLRRLIFPPFNLSFLEISLCNVVVFYWKHNATERYFP